MSIFSELLGVHANSLNNGHYRLYIVTKEDCVIVIYVKSAFVVCSWQHMEFPILYVFKL